MKLIEIKKNEHYVIVDDSEMREGDCWYNKSTGLWFKVSQDNIRMYKQNSNMNRDGLNKITHSTQPLENPVTSETFNSYGYISLSEVEEAINGYSVEKMVVEEVTNISKKQFLSIGTLANIGEGYILGFKAHQELVKDKLFTIEDVENIWNKFVKEEPPINNGSSSSFLVYLKQSLLPKTEWSITFDEQGKIKLI